jgi:hypothetical protein
VRGGVHVFEVWQSVVPLEWLQKQSEQPTVECWNHAHSAQNSSPLIEYWCVMHSVLKVNCGTIVLWGDNAEWYQNLLKMKRIASFNTVGWQPTLWVQLLYCKSSLVSTLLGMAFGHHDLQLSLR